ncbi:hypothetical protein BDZ90DRAFT_68734 [Jaminaea rosea]|uniref:Uncharacterized protein n=1 Tax=Jaminaea rosea TaxID=1569628 RepID=A0A316ULA1_9BASI|nr:hypothetical protein BDZ90DRAFT_68734 [Jaminaea rosea]PWN25578.1 hypothetical protein BDZ90DRAFT_68734 [Jaminaea rosea]
MPSSKGEPTDPQLRERIKEQIKKEAGGGWAAWCGAKLAKEYERQGGGYKNTPDNPNKPKKGTPEPKEGENRAAGGAAQTAKREKKEAEGKKGDGEKPDSKQKPSSSSAQKKDAGKKREASAKADGAEEPKEKKQGGCPEGEEGKGTCQGAHQGREAAAQAWRKEVSSR